MKGKEWKKVSNSGKKYTVTQMKVVIANVLLYKGDEDGKKFSETPEKRYTVEIIGQIRDGDEYYGKGGLIRVKNQKTNRWKEVRFSHLYEHEKEDSEDEVPPGEYVVCSSKKQEESKSTDSPCGDLKLESDWREAIANGRIMVQELVEKGLFRKKQILTWYKLGSKGNTAAKVSYVNMEDERADDQFIDLSIISEGIIIFMVMIGSIFCCLCLVIGALIAYGINIYNDKENEDKVYDTESA